MVEFLVAVFSIAVCLALGFVAGISYERAKHFDDPEF